MAKLICMERHGRSRTLAISPVILGAETVPAIFRRAVRSATAACGDASLLSKFQELQAKGETHAAKGLSEVLAYRCGTMTVAQRQNLVNAVNGDLLKKNEVAQAKAADCDGDGLSDF